MKLFKQAILNNHQVYVGSPKKICPIEQIADHTRSLTMKERVKVYTDQAFYEKLNGLDVDEKPQALENTEPKSITPSSSRATPKLFQPQPIKSLTLNSHLSFKNKR